MKKNGSAGIIDATVNFAAIFALVMKAYSNHYVSNVTQVKGEGGDVVIYTYTYNALNLLLPPRLPQAAAVSLSAGMDMNSNTINPSQMGKSN